MPIIPDCYDPVRQEERRQKEWDAYVDQLPRCTLCGKPIFPGRKMYTARYQIVCSRCKEELEDNCEIVEEPE